tara:strand:+ start:111 stop:218 length:108 start_codon:yes stop_codon:yes gene_type:complete
MRGDIVQFAGLDQGSDYTPVCGTGIVASEGSIFPV